MNNKTIGIYQIKCIVDDKIYIGSSRNIEERWYRHKYELKNDKHNNKYLQRAWNKYGEDSFEFTILEEFNDISLLFEREQYWMDLKDSSNYKKGYNNLKNAGTLLGYNHTQGTKNEISKSTKGENNPFHGKSHTDESKYLMSISHIGKKQSKETILKRVKKTKGRKCSEQQRKNISLGKLGEKNPGSKLKLDEVANIKILIESELFDIKTIAKLFNVCYETIHSIKKNINWKWVSIDCVSLEQRELIINKYNNCNTNENNQFDLKEVSNL